MDYETEEQQVEALKEWWRENGRSVILGVVLGAAAIFGWQGWGKYQLSQAEKASDQFTEVLDSLGIDETGADTVGLATNLQQSQDGSLYAVLATLAAAKREVDNNQLDAAAQQLRWAVEHADQADIKVIASLRLARVLAAAGDTSEALSAMPGDIPEAYSAMAEEVRGDLLLANGDVEGARAAYQKAMDSDQRVADRRSLTIKLNDLAVANKEDS